jgi:[calcium/calmodulin-dependent protein kinase] kinase
LQNKGCTIVRDENGDTHYKNLWQNVEKEIEIMKRLRHENIIKLYEILNNEKEGKIYLVVEFADKGEVLKWDEKK